MKDQYFNLVRN